MFKISPGSPDYLTSVPKDRLPVFRSAKIKTVVAQALNETRNSGGFLIFAYVIMLDHLHLVTDSNQKPEVILRYVNGIIARRVIDYLKCMDTSLPLKNLGMELIKEVTAIRCGTIIQIFGS